VSAQQWATLGLCLASAAVVSNVSSQYCTVFVDEGECSYLMTGVQRLHLCQAMTEEIVRLALLSDTVVQLLCLEGEVRGRALMVQTITAVIWRPNAVMTALRHSQHSASTFQRCWH
jgi:hypothetical protein